MKSKRKACPYKDEIKNHGWDMDYCIHCSGIRKFKDCIYAKPKAVEEKPVIGKLYVNGEYFADVTHAEVKR